MLYIENPVKGKLLNSFFKKVIFPCIVLHWFNQLKKHWLWICAFDTFVYAFISWKVSFNLWWNTIIFSCLSSLVCFSFWPYKSVIPSSVLVLYFHFLNQVLCMEACMLSLCCGIVERIRRPELQIRCAINELFSLVPFSILTLQYFTESFPCI